MFRYEQWILDLGFGNIEPEELTVVIRPQPFTATRIGHPNPVKQNSAPHPPKIEEPAPVLDDPRTQQGCPACKHEPRTFPPKHRFSWEVCGDVPVPQPAKIEESPAAVPDKPQAQKGCSFSDIPPLPESEVPRSRRARSVKWKETLQDVFTKDRRKLVGASGYVVLVTEDHLVVGFFDDETQAEGHAIASHDRVFVTGRVAHSDLFYRKVCFDAVPMAEPVFLESGASYNWIVRKVELKSDFEQTAEFVCYWMDPTIIPEGPDSYLFNAAIDKEAVRNVLGLTKALEHPCLMRGAVEHRTPPKMGGIYGAYVSGLNIWHNGGPVQHQVSNKGRDGIWVRIMVFSINYDKKKVKAWLVDWDRSDVMLDFKDVVPIPSCLAKLYFNTRE